MMYVNLDRDTNYPGIDCSYSEKLFLNLGAWRDKHSSLVGRVTTELALVGVSLIAIIEFFIRSQIVFIAKIFSKVNERYWQGLESSIYTSIYSIYALAVNLFSTNFTERMLDLEARLNPWIRHLPIYSVCKNGNYNIAEMLLTKDWVRDKLHDVKPNRTTDSLYSRLNGHPKLNPLFQLNDYEKDYLELKHLSHWLGLKGEVELHGNNFSLEGTTGNWMFDSLSTAISKFSKSKDFKYVKLGIEKAHLIEEALNLAYTEHSAAKISERIQNKTLSFIDAGWKEHAIGLAIYGNYMAVGNRGVGCYPDHSTLEVYKIDPSWLTPEIVKEIDSIKLKDIEAGKEYFYKTLPAKLSPSGTIEKDSLCDAFKSIAPFHSKGGHCALAGYKSALRFAWVMLLSDSPDKAVLEQGRLESKIFTHWTAVEKHKEFTPEKLTSLKERAKVYSQSYLKADRKWEKLQWHRWRAGCISSAQWNFSVMKNHFNLLVPYHFFWGTS